MTKRIDAIVATIRGMKGLQEARSPRGFAVRNREGVPLGWLTPIGTREAEDPNIIASLTKWRRMFMRYFLTQFTPSDERTHDWLRNVVIPNNDRILFMIVENSGVPIGNFGVCNLDEKEAELDNLIRGEKGGDRELIYYSEVALLWWLFVEMKISSVCLHVFSNNLKTIALHSRVGFSEIKRMDLERVVAGEEIKYQVSPSEGETEDFQYIKMALTYEEFDAANSWARDIYRNQQVEPLLIK